MLNDVETVMPVIDDVRALSGRIQKWILKTPVVRCRNLESKLGTTARLFGKLEFLQQTGTFKPRGALANVLSAPAGQLKAGVTAVSAGNHAIATAYAAQCIGVSAKVIMLSTANPARIELCKRYGAELVLVDDVSEAFARVEQIRDKEGRCYIHPFEGTNVTLGTATIGLEICDQVPSFDTVIVPIGGGGLCSGISFAVKMLNPGCKVIGVEPFGGDAMYRSFVRGEPQKLDALDTIADSLGAPFTLPHSFTMCRKYVDEIVRVHDSEISEAMSMLYNDMKIAVEPACAISTAALSGPLRNCFEGKTVVLVFCGSNIDWATFNRQAAPL